MAIAKKNVARVVVPAPSAGKVAKQSFEKKGDFAKHSMICRPVVSKKISTAKR